MQLGETHIPMCHDKQRLCQCSFFLTTTVRCVASVWGAKQQIQVASKEGAPERLFQQGGAKSNRKTKKKKETKSQEKSICTTLKKKDQIKTKHLTYLHLLTESKQRLDG